MLAKITDELSFCGICSTVPSMVRLSSRNAPPPDDVREPLSQPAIFIVTDVKSLYWVMFFEIFRMSESGISKVKTESLFIRMLTAAGPADVA